VQYRNPPSHRMRNRAVGAHAKQGIGRRRRHSVTASIINIASHPKREAPLGTLGLSAGGGASSSLDRTVSRALNVDSPLLRRSFQFERRALHAVRPRAVRVHAFFAAAAQTVSLVGAVIPGSF